MSMGRRKRESQKDLWIAAERLESRGHPFYRALNRILAASGFDAFVEAACERFYTKDNGRPSIAPGVYFRMLLVGYFEGIGSERGIDWRCADSLSLREFLGIATAEETPDHSTISRTRRLIGIEAHKQIFEWILKLIADEGLVSGKTLGADSTTLEANAAMRSIVRRDSGQSYHDYITDLAKAEGIESPTREDLALFARGVDRKRKGKASNADWKHESDPDARIAKMKDGPHHIEGHMAHKLEQVVDMETGAVLAAEIHCADQGDTITVTDTLTAAIETLERLAEDEATAKKMDKRRGNEVVLDRSSPGGYHSDDVLTQLQDMAITGYVSRPRLAKGKRRRWKGKETERLATIANARRVKGDRGKRLMRKRGELLERPFAHELETGGLRRTHVRGHEQVRKRIVIQAAAANLGLLMRTKFGVGTPRRLQDRPVKVMEALEAFAGCVEGVVRLIVALLATLTARCRPDRVIWRRLSASLWVAR